MTGLELSKKLKEYNPQICVILITGYATLEMAVEAIERDIDEYIIKPVDPGILKKTIKSLLSRQRLIVVNRELMEYLKNANMELKKLDKMKTKFLSMITHELCTPITSVIGYTQRLLAREEGGLNDIQRDYLRVIERASTNLSILIDDLLDLSRIEAGKFEMKFEPFNMNELIETMQKKFKFKLEQKKLSLEVNLAQELVDVVGDKNRLEQVINNFMTNAIKFSREDGNIVINSKRFDNRVKVEVIDNGYGMDPEQCSKIFESFYQAESEKKQEGLGIGLAIAKQIIDKHKGEIGAESGGIGKGSKFWFALPV
jgi:signal transduction histidine kinase